MKIVDDKYRKIVKQYLILIESHTDEIACLEEYKIDNKELDDHYLSVIDLLNECNKKLKSFGYGELKTVWYITYKHIPSVDKVITSIYKDK